MYFSSFCNPAPEPQQLSLELPPPTPAALTSALGSLPTGTPANGMSVVTADGKRLEIIQLTSAGGQPLTFFGIKV